MRFSKRVIVKSKKKRKALSFRQAFLLSFIIFIILTIQGIWIVDQGIRPTIVAVANMETQKIAMKSMNYAVKETMEDIDIEHLITFQYDEQGQVSTIGFDSKLYNQVVNQSVASVQQYMERLEEGERIAASGERASFQIPLGRVTDTTLLAQTGPRIPVQLRAIGDVQASLNEEVKASGINNTWIRVSLDLEAHVQVIIPFSTKVEKVMTTIPVGMVYVSGKVPEYYGGSQAPLPAVIIDKEKEQ